ncbi:Zn-ribbon domain-containing OB-fold protein [Novosphingobium bradum]|uniref:Zn-ribbon domain-containing OB-fold protein n=1 Tax=Novosphingobium bradum TaxID=1737444 RepID=A0ABV7IQY1_9SPHN
MDRPAPPLTDRTAAYWRSGADGVLRIARCSACGWRLHPPRPVCPRCRGREIAFQPVSGRGKVHSFAINRYQWTPAITPPYIMAEVELAEQPGLLILSNITHCALDEVRVDMAVTVWFERTGEAWIPLFRPEARR